MEKNNIKILFLDDENDIVEVFGQYFKLKGYISLTATSSEEALDIFAQEKPQICIFDITLVGSKLDGIQAWEKIREGNKTSICIFFSRKKEDETIERATKAGMFDFIEKPFLPPKLLEIVEKSVESLEKDK